MHRPSSWSHLKQIRPSQTAWDFNYHTSCWTLPFPVTITLLVFQSLVWKEVPVSSLGQIPMLRPDVGRRGGDRKSGWGRRHRQDLSRNGRKKRPVVRCGSRKPAHSETGSGFADFETANLVRIFDCCWIWVAQKKTGWGWTWNRVKYLTPFFSFMLPHASFWIRPVNKGLIWKA